MLATNRSEFIHQAPQKDSNMNDSEKKVLWGISIVLVFIGLTLTPWVLHVATPIYSSDAKDWADFGTYVGGVLSPILAGISFVGLLVTIIQQRQSMEKQKQDADSESYFKHAVQCLERAYRAIDPTARSDAPASVPICDRLAWLTSARLLLSAQQAAGHISAECKGIRALYEGEEEYWRHQFYELLKPTSFSIELSAAYFRANLEERRHELDEASIRVLYEFTEWPQGRQDPIENVPLYSAEDLNAFPIGMAGAKEYILGKKRFVQPRTAQ